MNGKRVQPHKTPRGQKPQFPILNHQPEPMERNKYSTDVSVPTDGMHECIGEGCYHTRPKLYVD